MAILQQRIYELETYEQVGQDEDGYVDPSTLYMVVDRLGWAKPKKMIMGNLFFSDHIEAGRHTATSVDIAITYTTSFENTSYTLMVYVYKEETSDGKVYRSTMPYYDLTETETGFSLTLEEYSGVIVKYFAYA